MFFFFKQVRISPEIDWYHYQSANAAPTGIVRLRINTDQFSRSVTSEPTVPPRDIIDDVVLKSCILYFCGQVGRSGGSLQKWRLKLTSAKVEVEVEAEIGKNNK